MRKVDEEGQASQYSKTSFLHCGMKVTWPFAGFERSEALKMAAAGFFMLQRTR